MQAAVKLIAGVVLASVTMLALGEAIFHQRTVMDPVFGHIPLPGSIVLWGVEGYGVSRWTEHGVRRHTMPDTGIEKTVLVLGDSFTSAIQVDDSEVYTHILEDRLRAADFNVAVLNKGDNGFSLADQIGWANVYRKQFNPSWVVVQAGWGDFTTEAWTSGRGYCFFSWNKDHSSLNVECPPVRKTRSRQEVLLTALPLGLGKVLSLSYPVERVNEFKAWWRDESPWFQASRGKNKTVAGQDVDPSNYPLSLELDLLSSAYNGRVTLLLLTSYNPLGPSRLNAAEETIINLCADKGISCIRLDQGFHMLPGTRNAPYGFDNLGGFNHGHLNADGHRIAAILLSDELKQKLSQDGIF